MIGGLPHLCKYISTPEDAQRFRSDLTSERDRGQLESVIAGSSGSVADVTQHLTAAAAGSGTLPMDLGGVNSMSLLRRMQEQQGSTVPNTSQLPSLSSLVSGLLSPAGSTPAPQPSSLTGAPQPAAEASASLQQLQQLQTQLTAFGGGGTGSFQNPSGQQLPTPQQQQQTPQQQQQTQLAALVGGPAAGAPSGTAAASGTGLDLSSALAALAPSLFLQQQQQQQQVQQLGLSPSPAASRVTPQTSLGGASTNNALAILSALQAGQPQAPTQQQQGGSEQDQLVRRLLDAVTASQSPPGASSQKTD